MIVSSDCLLLIIRLLRLSLLTAVWFIRCLRRLQFYFIFFFLLLIFSGKKKQKRVLSFIGSYPRQCLHDFQSLSKVVIIFFLSLRNSLYLCSSALEITRSSWKTRHSIRKKGEKINWRLWLFMSVTHAWTLYEFD